MQMHVRNAQWQPWLRGIAIVAALFAGPLLLALIWLSLLRTVL